MDDNRQSEKSIFQKFGMVLLFLGIMVCLFSGCKRLRSGSGVGLSSLTERLTASNDRDWRPDLAVLPWAEANGNLITVRNIRNSQYANADNYLVNHYNRTFDLSAIEGADYIVCPFNSASSLAHTMISFGLNDGTQICVSAEVRKEKSEDYSVVAGLARKFELMYVARHSRLRLPDSRHAPTSSGAVLGCDGAC